MLTIRFSLNILVSVSANGNYDIYAVSAHLNVEAPTAVFNLADFFLLSLSPSRAVGVHATNVSDAFLSVVTILLVYATDPSCFGHVSNRPPYN
nr:hypothetical protein [Rhodovulum sulfidophilum]